MVIESGTKLGPYEISGKIGAGGMGTVYQARDTRLGRDVAIKISAEQFSERFEREARTVAGLNHPNICTLHDVGPNYLVMELVEGPTLAERIAEGAMPVNEALNVARQIAAALSAAHEQGVVHRDLKPGNIKIKSGGVVRVLDFGLAKIGGTAAVTSDNSPTLNMTATQAGMILGTAAYMSPEQARGKSVDKRADIWAFGVVLFEMVTGRQLFAGGDLTDTLASVIKEEPDWNAAPAEVRRLLRNCLEKDPKKRLQDIGDMELLLEGAGTAPPPARNVLPWIVAGVVAVALAISLFGWSRAAQPAEPNAKQLLRLEIDLGPDVRLGSSVGTDVIISPDGNRLAYISQSHLYTRRLDQAKDVQLVGTEGAFSPFFSPSGEWIAFFSGNRLKKVAVAGGTPIPLCDAPNGRGGSWGADGTIIAALSSANNAISRIPEAGGKPEAVVELDRERGEITQRWPQILPGEKAVLLTSHTAVSGFDEANIDVYSFKDRRRTTLVRGGTYGRYLGGPDGHGYLIYMNRGSLFAVAMDLERLEVKGTPLLVLDDVGYNLASGSAQVDFSANGTLVFRDSASGGGLVNLQWLEPGAKTKLMLQKAGPYLYPSLSPDGNQVALGADGGISVYDTRREAPLQSLTGAGGGTYPLWSPDGLLIVFQSTLGISWTRADGASKPMPATQSKNPQYPWSFTDDGKMFSFMEVNPETGYDLWTASVESDAAGLRIVKAEAFLKTPADERHPSLSPDGHWLAYTSNDSGSYQVYVKAFPDKGGRFPVSTGVGMYPVWSHTSHEIFYRSEDNKIMVASYSVKGDSFAADKPRVWFEKPLANLGIYRTFDVSRDGKRIAALMPLEDQAAPTTLNHAFFLQNFLDDVRRRLTSVR